MSMEIKKREVIFSIIIIAVMLIIGFSISEHMKKKQLEEYQTYDTAVKIDNDEELFRYGMKTHIGNAFVSGNLKTVDPVSFSEVDGKYSFIKKEKQEYTKHTRPVTETYKDSKGKTKTRTKTEEYWTWDTIKTEKRTATKISFLNVEFAYDKIPFPSSRQIKIKETGYHKRNVYYATGTDFKGTIYTSLKDNTINETKFYKDQTISQTVENLESGHEILIFWIFWSILIIGAVIGFYYAENRWLD